MKKRMLALLLGLLCAGLTACGSTDTAAKDETPSAPTVEQPEPEPTPEEVRRTAADGFGPWARPGAVRPGRGSRGARPHPFSALYPMRAGSPLPLAFSAPNLSHGK